MSLMKLTNNYPIVSCGNLESSVDLGLSVVDSSTNKEPDYRYQLSDVITWSASDKTAIKEVTLDGNSFTALVLENKEQSIRNITIEVTCEILYFDDAETKWVSDGKSTASVQIQQDPNIPKIEIPDPPKTPPSEDSEFKKEYEENKKLDKELRDEIKKLFDKVWGDLLQLTDEFIKTWTHKIYDILCNVGNLVNQEVSIRKSKVYDYANYCIKIIDINDKLLAELKRGSDVADKDMIKNWETKISKYKSKRFDLIDDLYKNHTLTTSGKVELESWNELSKSVLVKFMTENYLNAFCQEYFNDNEQTLKEKLWNTFNLSNIGDIIKEKFNQLKNDGRVLANGVNEMVNSTITSVTEPMGAVITTPAGPGACVNNPLQIKGVVKRAQSQALALIPCITRMIDAAIFLGLPSGLIQSLIGISTTLTLVSSISF